jgi:hypothetical protein
MKVEVVNKSKIAWNRFWGRGHHCFFCSVQTAQKKTCPGLAVKQVHDQCYIRAYTEKWPCLAPSPKGATYVFCKLCLSNFSCAHGGNFYCNRHIGTQSHRDKVSLAASSSLNKYIIKDGGAGAASSARFQNRVTMAEVTMCDMVAELNLPLATADSQIFCWKAVYCSWIVQV